MDAIEPVQDKLVKISYNANILSIWDNGSGLSAHEIQQIYDFDCYVSKNRHIVNISRGKLGNGLKCIIGIRALCGYSLNWNSNDGKIVCPRINVHQAREGILDIDFSYTPTYANLNGVFVAGIDIPTFMLHSLVSSYAQCNPDTNFALPLPFNKSFEPSKEAINWQAETSIRFYSFQEFQSLLRVQDPESTYKACLGEYFGTRVKRASTLCCKIKDLQASEVNADFLRLQKLLGKNY